jgi:PAS domain S-box-containing protein
MLNFVKRIIFRQKDMKQSQTIIENEFSITVLLNEKLDLVYRSPSFATITGWTEEEFSVLPLKDFWHPDDLELRKVLFEETLSNPEKKCFITLRLKCKTGEYIWLEGTVTNKIADPDFGAIVFNMHEITVRKKKEILLNKTISRFNQAQAISHIGSWELDFSTGISLWSDEYCRIYGVPLEHNLHNYDSWISFIHPQDLDYVLKTIETAKLTFSKSSMNHRIVLGDGSVKYLQTERRFEFDSEGNPIGMYGIAQDITEKITQGNKLIHDELRMKEAQALAHVGHWELNFATGIALWSDESLRIYGLEFGENTQTYESWLSFIHPDDLDFVLKANKDGETDFRGASFIHRIVRKNGMIRWIHSQSRFDFDSDGKLVGLHGISHDITEAKEAEDKIKAQLEMLTEISSMQSHQVRGPISSLLGLISLMDFENPCCDLNFELIKKVKITAKKLDATIRNIVDKTNEVEVLNALN